METLKKIECGEMKTKIMLVRPGKEVEQIDEKVRQGAVLEANRYIHLGIAINTEGNLKDCIQEMGQKSNKILLEINLIGVKRQVEIDEDRVRLKQFKIYLIPAMLHGLQLWMENACNHALTLRTVHIKNTCVVCCIPKTLYGMLSQSFLIHSFSTLLITFFSCFPCFTIFNFLFTFLRSYSFS